MPKSTYGRGSVSSRVAATGRRSGYTGTRSAADVKRRSQRAAGRSSEVRNRNRVNIARAPERAAERRRIQFREKQRAGLIPGLKWVADINPPTRAKKPKRLYTVDAPRMPTRRISGINRGRNPR